MRKEFLDYIFKNMMVNETLVLNIIFLPCQHPNLDYDNLGYTLNSGVQFPHLILIPNKFNRLEAQKALCYKMFTLFSNSDFYKNLLIIISI